MTDLLFLAPSSISFCTCSLPHFLWLLRPLSPVSCFLLSSLTTVSTTAPTGCRVSSKKKKIRRHASGALSERERRASTSTHGPQAKCPAEPLHNFLGGTKSYVPRYSRPLHLSNSRLLSPGYVRGITSGAETATNLPYDSRNN